MPCPARVAGLRVVQGIFVDGAEDAAPLRSSRVMCRARVSSYHHFDPDQPLASQPMLLYPVLTISGIFSVRRKHSTDDLAGWR